MPNPKPNLTAMLQSRHPLVPFTTWRIGGPAEHLAAPRDLEEAAGLLSLAMKRGWPCFFLGRGSNVLIADDGLPGLTLHLAKGFEKLERQGETLRVGAGVALPRLAQAAASLFQTGRAGPFWSMTWNKPWAGLCGACIYLLIDINTFAKIGGGNRAFRVQLRSTTTSTCPQKAHERDLSTFTKHSATTGA